MAEIVAAESERTSEAPVVATSDHGLKALQIEIEQPKSKAHVWGVIVSIVYLGLLGSYAAWTQTLLTMKLNEFGDFLAGAFAPLAFLWLALGFFQQGEELRNSVKALLLQQDELRKSVEQQTALVGVTREQVDLERGEKLRAMAEHEANLETRLICKITSISFSESRTVFAAKIVNLGGSHLTQLFMRGERVRSSQKPIFSFAEEWPFTIDFKELVHPTSVTLSFINGKGEQDTETFEFVTVEDAKGRVVLQYSSALR